VLHASGTCVAPTPNDAGSGVATSRAIIN
jgi:hypothetical protein